MSADAIDEALNAVLRRAVERNDTALIEAYRHIWQGAAPKIGTADALRLGILLGLEARGAKRTEP